MEQRIAIVTGGLRGLGRAMAFGLAQAGHKVVAVGHIDADVATIEAAAAGNGTTGRILPLVLNLRRRADCDRVVAIGPSPPLRRLARGRRRQRLALRRQSLGPLITACGGRLPRRPPCRLRNAPAAGLRIGRRSFIWETGPAEADTSRLIQYHDELRVTHRRIGGTQTGDRVELGFEAERFGQNSLCLIDIAPRSERRRQKPMSSPKLGICSTSLPEEVYGLICIAH